MERENAVARPVEADEVAARKAAIERSRGMFAHLTSGRSLVDELIADRRAEARAEDLEETVKILSSRAQK